MLNVEKIIIVIATTISVCIMLLSTPKNNNEEENFKLQVKSNNEVKARTEDNRTAKSVKKEVTNAPIPTPAPIPKLSNAQVTKDKDVQIEKKVIEPREIKKTTEKIVNNANLGKGNNPEIINTEDKQDNVAPVFKVNPENILNDMSFFDKERIMVIVAKLKASDYSKITSLLQNDSQGKGVLDALKLLKDKLSNNDYSKIKQIAGKFINMDLVENN